MIKPISLGNIEDRFFKGKRPKRIRKIHFPTRLINIQTIIMACLLYFLTASSNPDIPAISFANTPATIETDAQSVECIAKTIYFESRGEPREGQVAVSAVIMSRVADSRWPDSPCEVVQSRKQFEWYGDNISNKMTNEISEGRAYAIAYAALEGKYSDPTNGATCYVRKDILRKWMRGLPRQRIGNHLFMHC